MTSYRHGDRRPIPEFMGEVAWSYISGLAWEKTLFLRTRLMHRECNLSVVKSRVVFWTMNGCQFKLACFSFTV